MGRGRPPKKLDGDIFTEYLKKYIARECRLYEFAEALGISESTLHARLMELLVNGELRCFQGENEVVRFE